MPANSENAIWEKVYRNRPWWEMPWQKHPNLYLENLVKSGKINKGRALDIGCGTGERSAFLAKNGFDVTGIDISPTAIKEAISKAETEEVNIRFVVGDVLKLPSFRNKFKFILDLGLLNELDEKYRDTYVTNLCSITEPGAQFFLRVYSRRDPSNKSGFFHSGVTDQIVYCYNKRDLDKMFNTKFKIIKYKENDYIFNNKKTYLDEFLLERL